MRRGFDKAAVAAQAAAFGADVAVGAGGLVRPNDDFTAVAVGFGIGFNGCGVADIGGFSVMYGGIFTLIVAAY